MISRLVRSAALVLTAAAIAACSGSPAALTTGAAPGADLSPSAAVGVKIANYAYSPKTITIKAGMTIKFVNHDALAHTVTANDGTFGSPFINPGRSWKHTFKKAGKYKYYCQIHPYMTGLIKVTK